MGRIGSRLPTQALVRLGGCAAVTLLVALVLAPAAFATDSPDLTITKTSDAAGTLSVGDRFSYTLTVSNVGTATAHKVQVEDNLPRGLEVRTVLPSFPGGTCTVTSSQLPPAPPSWAVLCTRDTLDPGSSAAVSFEVSVTRDVRCGELTNRATASSKDEPAATNDDNEASASNDVVCPSSISLETTAPSYAHIGGSIPFTMRVRNDGQTSLGSVDLRGPGCSPVRIGDGNGDRTLAVGEVWTYRCSRHVGAATPDPLTGTATVLALSDTEQKVSARDAATVRVLDPGLSINVSPDPISGAPGDAITYTYLVRNTGDAALSDLSVNDDRLGHIGDIAQLQPGHEATLHATRTLSATGVWVVNTATATGTDAGGASVSATDDASIAIVSAGGGRGDGTAFTGLDATPAAMLAAALGALGAGLLVAAKRRA